MDHFPCELRARFDLHPCFAFRVLTTNEVSLLLIQDKLPRNVLLSSKENDQFLSIRSQGGGSRLELGPRIMGKEMVSTRCRHKFGYRRARKCLDYRIKVYPSACMGRFLHNKALTNRHRSLGSGSACRLKEVNNDNAFSRNKGIVFGQILLACKLRTAVKNPVSQREAYPRRRSSTWTCVASTFTVPTDAWRTGPVFSHAIGLFDEQGLANVSLNRSSLGS